jgi:tetratricopeptide (TPR) repeat protein
MSRKRPAGPRQRPQNQGGVRRRPRGLLVGALLALLPFAAFSPVCSDSYEFISLDDPLYVSRNPHVQAGLTASSIGWAFTTFHAANWHPLTWLSLELDAQLYGTHPRGYHLTNVLLHAANTLLLFALLRSLTRAFWRSAAVAALFAIHPLRVESVAWVAERKDVLGALFWLLTLGAYAWYARRPRVLRYVLVVLALALGLMAKPTLVTLPCVLLLLDYWPLGRLRGGPAPSGSAPPAFAPAPFRLLVLEKLPLLALAAGCVVLTLRAQKTLVMSLDDFPFRVRLANALVSYVRYLAMMAWPSGLALQYPHPGDSLPAAAVAGASLLLAAITAAVLAARRRQPYLAVGWFWYLGTLVPVIGLVQVATQALADRYTYIPSIGVLIMVCWGAAELAGRCRAERAAGLVAGGTVLACAIATWGQVHYWSNDRTLWAHTLEVTGDGNVLAHNGLAVDYLQTGDLDRAEAEVRAALRGQPDYADAQYNLGLVYTRRQDWEQALRWFEAALRTKPAHPGATRSTALALLRLGRGDEALGYFGRARQADPEDAVLYYGTARCLEGQGKLAEAEGEYRRAAALAPAEPLYHYDLAFLLRMQGQEEASRQEYRQALQLDPDWPRAAAEQARALAAQAAPAPGDCAQGLRLAQQACQAADEERADFLDALAAAYACMGRFDEAVVTADRAAAVADAHGQRELADQVRRRRSLYQSGRRDTARIQPGAPAAQGAPAGGRASSDGRGASR